MGRDGHLGGALGDARGERAVSRDLGRRLAARPAPWSHPPAGRAPRPGSATWSRSGPDGRCVVVVPHESDARAWLEALRLVAGEEVGAHFAGAVALALPGGRGLARGARRGGRGARSRARAARRAPSSRLRARSSGVCPIAASDPAPSSSRADDELELEEPGRCELLALGYRRVDLVERSRRLRGARRRLRPLAARRRASRCALDLFGTEIESLRRFDPESPALAATSSRRAQVLPLALFPGRRRRGAASAPACSPSARRRPEPGRRAARAARGARATARGFPGWENLLPLPRMPRRRTLVERRARRAGRGLRSGRASVAEVERHAERLDGRVRGAARARPLRGRAGAARASASRRCASSSPAAGGVESLPLAAPRGGDRLRRHRDRPLPRPAAALPARGRGDARRAASGCLLVAAARASRGARRAARRRARSRLGRGGVELVAGELERGFRLPAAGVALYGETQLAAARRGAVARRDRGRASGRSSPACAT